MSTRQRLKYFIVILSIFFLVSCDFTKPRSWYKEGVIAVMADSLDWIGIKSTLRNVFERTIVTPQIEKLYELKYVDRSEFNRYTKFRYLILAATLKSKGKIGRLVKRVVSDSVIHRGVVDGKYFFFCEKSQWAKDQMMVILVAPDMATLREKIDRSGNLLYDIFDHDLKKRLESDMFKRREQKDIEKKLMSSYGWSIRVQHDYFLIKNLPHEGFVWFRRMYPERWIFVRWINGGDTTLLNQQWVVAERNRIGANYYSGDVVSDRYLFSYRGTFLGRPAQITRGLWQNNDKVAGGPFKNYTFYDELSRRVYMIDVAVFAPTEEKVPYLRRLDIIAQTFKTLFDTGGEYEL